MPLTTTTKPPVAPARASGLPIGAWLVLGFALVIGAFTAASVVSLRSTRGATADLERMQQQFEPLSRSVRDLGDGVATFDRTVLAYLRAGTRDKHAATVASAERLSQAAGRMLDVDSDDEAPPVGPLLRRIADHEAQGFELLNLQDARRRAVADLESAYAALDRRARSAGGSGVVVGDNLLARPSLAELARAVEAARHDALSELTRGGNLSAGPNGGESRLRQTIESHRAEFAASPGGNWLAMQTEDFNRAVKLRRQALRLGAEIEARQATFAAEGDALAVTSVTTWRRLPGAHSPRQRRVPSGRSRNPSRRSGPRPSRRFCWHCSRWPRSRGRSRGPSVD